MGHINKYNNIGLLANRNAQALFFGLLIFLVSGCRDESPKPDLIIPYQLQWEIDAGLNSVETHFFPFPSVRTKVEDFFDEDFPLEEIEQVRARKAELILRDPQINFDEIRFIEVFFREKHEPFQEYEVFYTQNLQRRGRQTIRLIPTLSNIQSIYLSDLMEVTVRVQLYQGTSRALPVRLEMELEAFRD